MDKNRGKMRKSEERNRRRNKKRKKGRNKKNKLWKLIAIISSSSCTIDEFLDRISFWGNNP